MIHDEVFFVSIRDLTFSMFKFSFVNRYDTQRRPYCEFKSSVFKIFFLVHSIGRTNYYGLGVKDFEYEKLRDGGALNLKA